MKNGNICRFVSERTPKCLATTRFIFISEAEHTGDSVERIMPTDRILLIAGGTGTVTVNRTEHSVGKGTLIFLFAGQLASLTGDDALQYLYIDYSGDRAAELYARFGITENTCVIHGFKGLIPVWKESLARANGENADLLSESMLLYAFSRLDRQTAPAADTVHLVTEYVAEHCAERGLSLQSTAEALGYNAKYLSHLIKTKMGVGFSEYLKELRLRQAILLIGQGVTSVKNISILCGFSDPLYFSKVFRQKFDVSPREFIAHRRGTPAGNPDRGTPGGNPDEDSAKS